VNDLSADHVDRIDVLAEKLYEISASLKYLEESQRIITSLIEAKAEHHVEIMHIKAGVDRQANELAAIHHRIAKIEAIFQAKKEARSNLRYLLYEVIREHWHFIAISASLISFVISYIFGIRINFNG